MLKSDIEQYASNFMVSHPFFIKAKSGEIKPEQIEKYLASLYYLVHHTPIHLSAALNRSLDMAATELVDHFRHKLGEEDGHDQWAIEDLVNLRNKFGLSSAAEPLFKMTELVRKNANIVATNPRLYLIYILFSEYVTVLLSPDLVDNLEKNCQIPAHFMSILTNHAELDREHVREGLAEIDRLIPATPEYIQASQKVLKDAMKLFDDFCLEVAN